MCAIRRVLRSVQACELFPPSRPGFSLRERKSFGLQWELRTFLRAVRKKVPWEVPQVPVKQVPTTQFGSLFWGSLHIIARNIY